MLSNLALATNLMNQLTRTGGGKTQHSKNTNAWATTHSCAKNHNVAKNQISQQASYHAAKKHDTESTAKYARDQFKTDNARQTYTQKKLGAYEDYAQPHSQLPEEASQRIRPPEPERQDPPSQGSNPDQPKQFRFHLEPGPPFKSGDESKNNKASGEGKGGKNDPSNKGEKGEKGKGCGKRQEKQYKNKKARATPT